MATTRPTRPTLTTWAEHLAERNPGHRFEIIGGVLTVTPLPDSAHDSIHRRYSPGEAAVLPGSVGAEVTLEAAEILAAGRPKKSD